MPTLVDSHCHINFDPLASQLPRILQNARDQGVEYLLCVSVNLEDFPQVLALAQGHPHIFASVGVHPDHQDCREPTVEQLVELAQDASIVAIGETGLDYYRLSGDMPWQQERFRRHIRAARASGNVKLPSPQKRSSARSLAFRSSSSSAWCTRRWLSAPFTWMKSVGRKRKLTSYSGKR